MCVVGLSIRGRVPSTGGSNAHPFFTYKLTATARTHVIVDEEDFYCVICTNVKNILSEIFCPSFFDRKFLYMIFYSF